MSIDINAVITEVEDLVKSVETGDIESVLRDVSALVTVGADIIAGFKANPDQSMKAAVCPADAKARLDAACDRLRGAVAGRRAAAMALPAAATAIDWQAVLKVAEQLIPVILSLFGV